MSFLLPWAHEDKAMSDFSAYSPEVRLAAERFESETDRIIFAEIEEREERMIRLFLIFNRYHPADPAPTRPTPLPKFAQRR